MKDMDQLFTFVKADILFDEIPMNVYATNIMKGEFELAFPFVTFHP
jgi:hypothetical protein